MDIQTLLVFLIIALAAAYVGRSVWPRRQAHTGCSTCPQNKNRTDDYA